MPNLNPRVELGEPFLFSADTGTTFFGGGAFAFTAFAAGAFFASLASAVPAWNEPSRSVTRTIRDVNRRMRPPVYSRILLRRL